MSQIAKTPLKLAALTLAALGSAMGSAHANSCDKAHDWNQQVRTLQADRAKAVGDKARTRQIDAALAEAEARARDHAANCAVGR